MIIEEEIAHDQSHMQTQNIPLTTDVGSHIKSACCLSWGQLETERGKISSQLTRPCHLAISKTLKSNF